MGATGVPRTPKEKTRSRQQQDQQGQRGRMVRGQCWGGGADGEGEGSTVDQMRSRTAQRGWEDGEWREMGQCQGQEAGRRGCPQGDGYPDARENKNTNHYPEPSVLRLAVC